MKRKVMLLMSTVVIAAMLAVGCGSNDSDTKVSDDADAKVEAQNEEADTKDAEVANKEEADAEASEQKTFILGFDAEYPPYGYMDDDGEYTGFDIEMAKLVCESLGWELVLKPIDWDSKDMELESGIIDCIWNGFSITPDRTEQYAWSTPYVNNSQVIVVSAESGIKSLEEISGLNVAVQAGSAALEALKADECADWTASFATLSEVPDYNTAFMNLEAGSAEAVAVDIAVAEYQLSIRDEGAYVILDEPFYTEPYAIGFRVDDTELRDTIDAEYMKLVEDGTYEELATEFGVDTAMLALLD